MKNSCADKHQVTEDNEKTCDSVEEPPVTLPYDPYMAQILAKWCSLSYVQPELKDEDSIKSVVASQIGSSYRVSDFITIVSISSSQAAVKHFFCTQSSHYQSAKCNVNVQDIPY